MREVRVDRAQAARETGTGRRREAPVRTMAALRIAVRIPRVEPANGTNRPGFQPRNGVRKATATAGAPHLNQTAPRRAKPRVAPAGRGAGMIPAAAPRHSLARAADGTQKSMRTVNARTRGDSR